MSDQDLLQQWAAQRDARAFREIVKRYTAMVYATCCRVLGDATDAEDITQECFEVLARSERQPRTHLGAWLHAVAVNRCLNHVKAAQRRRERERRYAEQAAPAAGIAWSDVYEYVDQAIQELPGELRVALVAHYLQGESHAAIARQLGVPRRTVSNRVTRGVELVSAALKKRGVTMTVAALGALFADNLAQAEAVPASLNASLGKLALAQGGAREAATGAAAMGGGGVMLAAKVAGVIAVVVAAAVYAWHRPEAESAAKAARLERTAVSPTRTSAPPPAGVGVAASPQAPSTSEPNSVQSRHGDDMLVCEVVTADGTPVPGAHVEVRPTFDALTAYPTHSLLSRAAITDSSGIAVFDNVPKGTLYISAEAEHGGLHTVADIWAFHFERLMLKRDALFEGHVLDTESRPVPNARVFVIGWGKDRRGRGQPFANGPCADSAADGAFRARLPYGETFEVLVHAPGYAAATASLLAGDGNTVVLGAGSEIVGALHQSETDQPAEGVVVVAVAADESLDQHAAVVDETGAFVLRGLRSVDYALRLSHPTLVLDEPDRRVSPGSFETLSLGCEAGAVVAGRAYVTGDDAPVADARVKLSWRQGEHRYARAVRTDKQGAFQFAGVAPGAYSVSIDHLTRYEVEPASRSQEFELATGEKRTGVDFPHQRKWGGYGTISGRVTDGNGGPASRTFVSALVDGATASTARTDAQGCYVLEKVPMARNVEVSAYTLGAAAKKQGPLALTEAGLRDVDFVLEFTGSISGRVVDTAGKPIAVPGTRIALLQHPAVWMRMHTAFALHEGGVFRIPNLPAGQYGLYVDFAAHRGNLGWREPHITVDVGVGEAVSGLEIVVDPPRQTDAEHKRAMRELVRQQRREREERGWGIKGRVVDATTGKPIPDFQLDVRRMGLGHTNERNDKGRFTVDPEVAAYTTLHVMVAGYAPHKETLYPEQARDGFVVTTIRLEPGPVVEGTVTDAAGKPVAGAYVYPGKIPDSHLQNRLPAAVTRADGSFRLDVLAAGPQSLHVEHTGYAIAATEIAPVAGKTIRTAVVLTHGATIEGNVIYDGAPLTGARVGYFAEPSGRRQFAVKTDATGHYRIENLRPGDVKVNVQAPRREQSIHGIHWQHRTVSVEEGETARADFEFRERTSRIEGYVTHHGEPVARPSVSVSFEREGTREDLRVNSDETGFYQTQNLPCGDAILRVSAHLGESGSQQRVTPITVRTNEVITCDVAFDGTSTITGTVEGLRVSENVYLKLYEGELPLPANLDEDRADGRALGRADVKGGAFVLGSLAPGKYTLRAVSSVSHGVPDMPIRVAQAVVTLTEGEILEVALQMVP